MDPVVPPHEVATTLRPLVYGAALAVMFSMRAAEPAAEGPVAADPAEPPATPRRRRRFRHGIGDELKRK